MKIAKKTLSVFLSLLMVFSACSVALTGLSFTAAASTKVSAQDAYNAVIAAIEGGSGSGSLTNGNNSYTLTGDNGLYLEAAEKLWDYAYATAGGVAKNATNGQTVYTYSSSDNNATVNSAWKIYHTDLTATTVTAKTINDLSACGALSTAAQNFIKNILGDRGTGLTTWSSGSLGNKSWNQNKSKGDDVTTSGKFSYSTTRSSVTKTTSITTDVNAYLCRFNRDTIGSASDVVRTSVSYVYDHFPAYYAYVSATKSNTCGDPTLTVPTYSWQQLDVETLAQNRELGENDTETVKAFKKYLDLITPAMLNTTYDQMLAMKADAVKELYDKMTGYMFGNDEVAGLTNESFYVAAVTDIYFPGATDYLNNLKKAYNVILAKNAMDVLNEYINMSYDDTNEAQMANIYGKVSSAWETYNKIPNMNLAEEVIASYPIFNNYANRAAFEADCDAYIVELYKNLSTIKIRELRNNLTDLINTYGDKVTDPYVSEYVVTNELISQINGLYSGYSKSMNEYANGDDQRVVDFYNEIFNEGNFLNGTVKPFAANLQLLTDERGAEAYADEILTKISEYASSVSVLDLTNQEATDRYDELLGMEGAVNAAYASWKAKLANNEDLTHHAFRVLFENDYLFLVEMAKEITEEEIRGRNDAQLDIIAKYAGSGVTNWNEAITIYNFAAVSNAVNSFDTPLYNYCLAQGWVSDYNKGIFDSFDDIKAAVVDFKAHDGYISTMKTQHLYDENGLFKTRYAGSQMGVDPETGTVTQLGYPNDIARDGAADNYDVTKSKVDQTIVKLDSFLTSNDFAELIGLADLIYETQLKNAEKKGIDPATITKKDYKNLSEVIADLLDTMLFTDDFVNTIFGALYPMIVNLIEGLLLDLGSLGTDIIKPARDQAPGSAGYLDITGLNVTVLGSKVTGGLDIYLDGREGTVTLPALAESLGLSIYPSSIAKLIQKTYPGQYTEIVNVLSAADRNWAVIVGDDGDIPVTFDWGIKSYNDFIKVLSIVIASLGDLLDAVLFNQEVKLTSTDSAVYAKGSLKLGVEPYVHTKAGLGVTIQGLNAYQNIWCKLLDALGIHDYVTNINGNSSAETITHALLDPIHNFIGTLANAPLQTVLGIIPNLLFILSMDKVSDIVDTIKLGISLDININWDSFGGDNAGSSILAALVKAFKGSLNDATKGIYNDTLDVISLINEEGLPGLLAELGISDYTDINLLISDVVAMLELGGELKLPVIDTGAIISTSTYHAYKSGDGMYTAYNNGRFTLIADKADVLYYLLTWIFGALGTEDLQNFVFDLIGDGLSDTLKSLIGGLLTGMGKNAKDAVAALTELVMPKEGGYSTAAMEWVNVDAEATTDRKFDTASVVYLKYNTDWTREKADYMINNIDEIVESVLRMTGSDIQTISGLLQEAITGLFTNKNFSGVVKELVSLGYTLRNDYIYNLFKNDLGLEIRSWAASLSEYFPDVVAKYEEDEDAITDFTGVVSSVDPKLTAEVRNLVITDELDEETNEIKKSYSYDVVWFYDGKEFKDGDISMFMDLFSAVAGPFAKIIAMFFNGSDFSIFDGALTFTGYDNYANSIGILFEILGINEPVFDKDGKPEKDDEGNIIYKVGNGYNHILTQAEYNTMSTKNPMDAFNYITTQLFKWVTEYLLKGNTLTKVIELVPRFTYFVESNGISTVLHNLLMPIFVVIDTIRPIIDLNFNEIVSSILADILNSVSDGLGSEDGIKLSLDLESILAAVLGNNVGDMDPNHNTYAVDLNHFTFVSLLQILDTFLGTELAMSPLVTLGINNICSQPKAIEGSVLGAAYGSSVDVTDAFTIFITSLIEAFTYTTTSGVTNGEIICAFIQQFLPADSEINVSEIYAAAVKILAGVEVPHEAIQWSYMINEDGTVKEQKSIVYLQYNTDWTEGVADTLDEALDGLVDEVLKMALGEDQSIATLLNGILEDKVYSDEILATVVELLVNAIAALDGSLRSLVDVALATDIAAWFEMCEEVTDADGNVTYKLIDGYFDIDNAADKKKAFTDAIEEVLAPANSLLGWLFFGESIELFTSSKTDANGKYTYESIIKLNGGEGYAYGIVPILEALGCTTEENGVITSNLKPASAYYDEVTGVYNVGAAVTDIFNVLLARVDEISGKPAHEVFDLLPNILFFINANGVKASVNNLLAPVNAVIEQLSPVIPTFGDDASIGGLLAETLGGLNISKLTTENILSFVCDKTGLVLSDKLASIIATFYIGETKQFVSANGEYAYKMAYTAEDNQSRADMITILLSVALEIFKINKDLFEGVLPEGMYDTIIDIIGGAGEIKYSAPTWDYMGEDIFAELLAGALSPANVSVVYKQYANDWNTTSASKLEANLAALLEFVLNATDTDLSEIINSAIADNLYSDDILNTIVEAIVGLLYGLDESLTPIVNAAGAVLGANLDQLYKFCTIEEVDGETVITCTEPWNVTDRQSFANALGRVLAPVDRILDWLFLGKDYKFFNDSNSDVIITIGGGEGYAKALAPLLEALGCKLTAPAADATSSAVVTDIVMALLARVDEIFGSDVETSVMINEVLDLIVNLIYFIDADGAKTVVNNLLAPVDALLKKVTPIIDKDATEPMTIGSILLDQVGFDISALSWNMIFDILHDNLGITLTDSAKALIKNFYLGKIVPSATISGMDSYKMTLATAEDRRDMLTVVLSVALETLELDSNAAAFEDLFGTDTYQMIIGLLKGPSAEFVYAEPNWAYMYEGSDALAQLIANNLPARTGENSIVYTKYTNNWNFATADYLTSHLDEIVNAVVGALKEEGSTVGILIDAAITDGLYKDAILDKLLVTVVKLLAGLDYVLVDSVGALLDIDVATWFSWCDIEKDADGKVVDVTVTKNWNIDSKPTNAAKKAAFVAAFTEALAPANRVIDWLFFGQDYTFLNAADNSDLITIAGGEGYAYAIVPILEALGSKQVKAAVDYYDAATGKYNTSAAVSDVFAALCERLTSMCGDDSLATMLDMLLNVVYFINADGVKTSVNNLLQPVYFVLEKLSPVVGGANLDELAGLPLSDLTFETIFDIVADKVGLHFRRDSKDFVESFYMGKVEQFASKNGNDAFRMLYLDSTDSRRESSREMLTILLSLVIENVKFADNREILSKWFSPDVYDAIIGVLEIDKAKDKVPYNWLFEELAGTGKTVSAIETSGKYKDTYNEYWTRDKAMYIANNLEAVIGNALCLLGLEVDNTKITDLETLLDAVISSNLYTQANADAILDAIKNLTNKLTTLEPYGAYIGEILLSALDFDIHAWDNMTVSVVDGDRETFEQALAQIVAPAAPLFALLLAGEDFRFFIDIEGKDQIVLYGSEGYAYGIIPVLEALDCDPADIATPAEFKAHVTAIGAGTEAEKAAAREQAVKDILTPIFNRVAVIEADPVNEILNMLPGVIYFINSNGLDTAVKNIVRSVDTVLEGLAPVINDGTPEKNPVDLMSLLGVDLSTYDFEWIINMALDSVEESTGFKLKKIALDAVAELTVGKVEKYQSVNGETYCTMDYAAPLDKGDMVTIVLRILVDFVTIDENIGKIEEILAGSITDEKTYKSVCSLLEQLSAVAKSDPSMGKALYVLYYIFVGVNNGLEFSDDLYHDANNSWQFILKMLTDSEEPVLSEFGEGLKSLLNKYLDDIFDDQGVAPNGFIRFFQKIAEFFRKIGDFFRKLFGRA